MKPNWGIDGAGASVIFLEKNSIDDRFSRDEEAMLLILFVRDIV